MTTTNEAIALPDYSTATLPATYERAKDALAACERIDECKDWADKMAALASYARQADDQALMSTAVRIQSRAIRRVGELLKTFQSPGGRPSKTPAAADGSFSQTQRAAADAAGISPRQELTAVRVANVPADVFEAAVETVAATIEAFGRGEIELPAVDPKDTNKAHIYNAPPGGGAYTCATVARFLNWKKRHGDDDEPTNACRLAFDAYHEAANVIPA